MGSVLNRGTTENGQKRAETLSALYARARAKKRLPKPGTVPLEQDEEDTLARLKTRRRSASKSARV